MRGLILYGRLWLQVGKGLFLVGVGAEAYTIERFEMKMCTWQFVIKVEAYKTISTPPSFPLLWTTHRFSPIPPSVTKFCSSCPFSSRIFHENILHTMGLPWKLHVSFSKDKTSVFVLSITFNNHLVYFVISIICHPVTMMNNQSPGYFGFFYDHILLIMVKPECNKYLETCLNSTLNKPE
jgi:hypothetical protein